MNGVSEAIASWLERKRRTDRASAAVISLLALGSGTAVFLVATLVIYTLLSIACGAFVHPVWLGLAAFGLTAGFFAHVMNRWQDGPDLGLDPMGYWIIKDICSIGPRLILEGLRQVRCCGLLGELNVAACARALAYLAEQNAAVSWEDLMRHCPQVPSERLREQLSLLDGVLFLGEDASRVTLMDPFRLRLRWMLEQEQRSGKGREPARPRPEPPPPPVPVEPEKLSAYEILGLPASASVAEIKLAYRKRIKECHPDLFAGMDQQAKALAERWTKALNAAYATLNPRHRDASPNSSPQRRAGSGRDTKIEGRKTRKSHLPVGPPPNKTQNAVTKS
jgi:DnaJ-domain-containing protein 1